MSLITQTPNLLAIVGSLADLFGFGDTSQVSPRPIPNFTPPMKRLRTIDGHPVGSNHWILRLDEELAQGQKETFLREHGPVVVKSGVVERESLRRFAHRWGLGSHEAFRRQARSFSRAVDRSDELRQLIERAGSRGAVDPVLMREASRFLQLSSDSGRRVMDGAFRALAMRPPWLAIATAALVGGMMASYFFSHQEPDYQS